MDGMWNMALLILSRYPNIQEQDGLPILKPMLGFFLADTGFGSSF
jgi:hypothetical protein